MFDSDPPLRIGAKLLAAMVEQAEQESKLASSVRAIEKRLTSTMTPISSCAKRASNLRVGDRIMRGWGDANHEVTILATGFAYRGKVYRSLSEIARLITGARWSGPRFFATRESAI